jgi:hypothetical protein
MSDRNSNVTYSVTVDDNSPLLATRMMRDRLTSIKLFGTIKMPQFQFQTQCFAKPLFQQIIVNSESISIVVNHFPYELSAIKHARTRFYERTHYWDDDEGLKRKTGTLLTEHDHKDLEHDVILFDIEKIRKQMSMAAISSPVYQVYQSKENVNDRHKHERSVNNMQHMNRLQEKTKSIWKDDLRSKNEIKEMETDDDDDVKERMNVTTAKKKSDVNDVPFYIIKRIGDSLMY